MSLLKSASTGTRMRHGCFRRGFVVTPQRCRKLRTLSSPHQTNVIVNISPQRASLRQALRFRRNFSNDYRTSGGWITEAQNETENATPSGNDKMPIIHIVLFEFKPTTSHAQVEDVCKRMVALSEKCIHPQTNKPYVKGYGGGRDTSPEGQQGGFSHGFVSEFQNEEDRQYYLYKDPAHLEFKEALREIKQNVRVIDFEPGKF